MSAALYIRLSKEDDRDGPSESVTNQRALLEKYAAEHRLTVHDIYVDDGWSGCNFDRPGFQRLLEDIESGRVNMVITKDLSRLGRDYILTGHYLERYFPEHGVRYVSLLDGIDTGSDSSSNDITPFRAIMNDMYARDISRKITSVKRDKQRRGQFIGGKPVYGYRMHPTEKNRIIPDESAAAVVRRVFSMALSGTSCRAIADVLNAEGVLSPSVYARLPISGPWSGERISEMLQNETYLGNMVQGRRVKVSYKSKKSLRKKREDWIVVEGTHEAIVDKATFDAVQIFLASRRHTRNRIYDFSLKGLVFCGECGHPLGVVNRKNARGDDTLYFVCRTYQRSVREKKCSAHCVKVDTVTDAVISTVFGICADELSFASLCKTADRFLENEVTGLTGDPLPSLIAQRQKITLQIDRLCLDRFAGAMEEEDFSRLYQQLCTRRSQIDEKIAEAERGEDAVDGEVLSGELTGHFLEGIKNDRTLLSQLIEKVELTEQRELIITFRFSSGMSV